MRKGNICEDANAKGNSSDRLEHNFFFFIFFSSIRVSHLSLLLPFASYSEAVYLLIKVFFVYLVRANAGNETRTKYTNNRSYNRSIESLCNYTYVIRNERERERMCVCLYVREKECVDLFRLHCITIISLA